MAALLLEARRRRWRDDDALHHQQHQHQHREDVVVVRRRRRNTSGVTMTLCAGLYVLVLLALVGVTSAGSREERIVPRSSCRLYIYIIPFIYFIVVSNVGNPSKHKKPKHEISAAANPEKDIYHDLDGMLTSALFNHRDCVNEVT
uniref:Uncharacterized protein n=1 Tax=Trichogramma kaykai TaxID=54128 RepID=A0ABD2WQQ0_9HYME